MGEATQCTLQFTTSPPSTTTNQQQNLTAVDLQLLIICYLMLISLGEGLVCELAVAGHFSDFCQHFTHFHFTPASCFSF